MVRCNAELTFVRMMFCGVIVGLAGSGCETPVDVFVESDAHYSMFGVLDVSADTQWVRVEALQDSLRTGSTVLDARFKMTQLSTGRQVVWRDSLFQYLNGFQAHNMWTDEPIQPLESYRLEVTRSDGAVSARTVTLPEDFEDPLLNAFPFSLINLPVSGNVCARTFDMVVDVEQLAALQISYVVPTVRGTDRRYDVSYIPRAEPIEGGTEVRVTWVRDLQELAALDRDIGVAELLLLKRVDLLVAAAGPGWPDNALPDETVALPGAVTEIENGFGFVGGVVSKHIEIPLGDFRDTSCFD